MQTAARVAIIPIALTLLILNAGMASAQRVGQGVSIQYGKVTGASEVDLQSGAVPAGVLVGGGLGLASASGKSSGKKARNAMIGAAATGAIAASAEGNRKGVLYQVDVGNAAVQVVSDQREIRTGDCVAVEKAGDTTNVRRVSASYCEKENAEAVEAVSGEARKDAEECAAAKQQLVDASTPTESDMAARKISLLCND